MVKRKYSKAGMRKPMSRSMKESYSDIDYSNVWDAYDVAMGYLGAEEFCEALAKAMGTDELESNLKYIFRVYEIPFMDDEEEFDEGCHRKSKKRRKSMKEAVDDDTVYVVFRKEKNPTEDEIFYGNDVTAFIYGNGIPVRYGNIMCYQHVGQHGEASLDYYNSTKPATPDEYADLLSELKSIYDDVNLVVRRKIDYNILRNEWRR